MKKKQSGTFFSIGLGFSVDQIVLGVKKEGSKMTFHPKKHQRFGNIAT